MKKKILLLTVISLCMFITTGVSAKVKYYKEILKFDEKGIPDFEHEIKLDKSRKIRLTDYLYTLPYYYAVKYVNNEVVNYVYYKNGVINTKYEYTDNKLRKVMDYNKNGEIIKIHYIDDTWNIKYFSSYKMTKTKRFSDENIQFFDIIKSFEPSSLQDMPHYFKCYYLKLNNGAERLEHYEYYRKNKLVGQYIFYTNLKSRRLKAAIEYNDFGKIKKISQFDVRQNIKTIKTYNSNNELMETTNIHNGNAVKLRTLKIDY